MWTFWSNLTLWKKSLYFAKSRETTYVLESKHSVKGQQQNLRKKVFHIKNPESLHFNTWCKNANVVCVLNCITNVTHPGKIWMNELFVKLHRLLLHTFLHYWRQEVWQATKWQIDSFLDTLILSIMTLCMFNCRTSIS